MKKLKKVLAIVICSAIVFSLVGCGDEKESGGSNIIISSPSAKATEAPTANATDTVTEAPTGDIPSPTAAPTDAETAIPTDAETVAPTDAETAIPTESSTAKPTENPTAKPTNTTTAKPSGTKVNVSIEGLPASFVWNEAGYSTPIIGIDEHTGVFIGTFDLSKVDKIIVYYGADANADISKDKIYLNDSNYTRLASNTLERSNGKGWATGVRAIELTVDSSYSGDLYLTKDEPGNQIAISAIEFYGSGISASTPTPSQNPQGDNSAIANKIIQEAKLVTEFAKNNGFKYGNATINPALNWKDLSLATAIDPSEKLTACDRLVCWVLYRAGFTNQQRSLEGADLFKLFEECKFQKITDVKKLQTGDICFTDTNGDNNQDHVFIIASNNLGGNVYLRYDHGSDARIQCKKGTEVTPGKQPFKEGIGGFVYAYRPNDKYMPNADEYNSLLVAPSKTLATPSNNTTTVIDAGAYKTSSGWGTNKPSYRYTPGSDYKQFEFHITGLTVSSHNNSAYWNNCYVGARLPSLDNDASVSGGVWLGFSPGNIAYVYSGINPISGNWNVIPLAAIQLPETMTAAHKIIVTDDGEVIRYYMVKSNNTKVLICSIVFNKAIGMMAVYGSKDAPYDSNPIDPFPLYKPVDNKLIYWGPGQAGNSGYFKIWAHDTSASATKVEIKGAN